MAGGATSGAAFDCYSGITSTPTLTTVANSATAFIISSIRQRLGGNQATFNVASGTTPDGILPFGISVSLQAASAKLFY